MEHSAVQFKTVLSVVVQCSPVKYSVIRCSTVWSEVVQGGPVEYSVVWLKYSVVQCDRFFNVKYNNERTQYTKTDSSQRLIIFLQS